jgi:hypothetical protein
VAARPEPRGGRARARRRRLLLRSEPGRVAIKQAAGPVWVEIGDVTPGCLAELFRTRTAKKPDDDRAAALFCLLEGDVEAAKKIAGAAAARIPEKYWHYGAKVGEQRRSPDVLARESEARELWRASRTACSTTRAPSVDGELPEAPQRLRGHRIRGAESRRDREPRRRPQGLLLLRGEPEARGSWKAGKSAKAEACWTCEKDSVGNYVDLSFSALPNSEYRCWVYVGACCQDTFAFFAQGTEMKTRRRRRPRSPAATSWFR